MSPLEGAIVTQDRDSAKDLLSAALEYARRGWPVIPLHSWTGSACSCARPDCKSPAKHPRTEHGLNDATTDEATIRDWWTRWPDANVGVVTGAVSGLVVLDVDPRHNGDESLAELERQFRPLPETIEALTGGGGCHIFFAHPGGTIRSRAGELGDGLDLKADGGYVVAPPSLHASGRTYEWEVEHHPDDVPLAPMPPWLLAKLNGDRRRPSPPIPERVPHGTRDDTFASLAGTMRRRGMSEEAILAALRVETSRCDPPLEEVDLRRISHSIARYPPAGDGHGVSLADIEAFHLTDLGNARRLVVRHGADLRYCHARKSWLVWDGRRWLPDDTGAVFRRAKDTIHTLFEEALQEENLERKGKLLNFACQSEKAERIKAMIVLAQSEPTIPVLPGELDAHPWLLNCKNGTLDLRTGALREHSRVDLITKVAPVDFDPGMRSVEWEKFLEETTGGDESLEAFLQRAVGYSLTGDTREEVLLFVHGPGSSGKSTYLEALKAVLGDYARTADFEAFLSRRITGGPRNDIARLAGARLVVSIEVEEGKKLAEGLVKTLTGGDTVTTRWLYKEAFEFKAELKLWLAANHAPRIRDDDDAIWRRILRVPFTNVVPPERQDKTLKPRLCDPEISGTAILAWAFRGCLAWQKDGLGVPGTIQAATHALREEMDPLGEFIRDWCVLEPEAWCLSKEIWGQYQKWCGENGEKSPLGRKGLAERLEARGLKPGYRDRSRAWIGVRIRAEREDGVDPLDACATRQPDL